MKRDREESSKEPLPWRDSVINGFCAAACDWGQTMEHNRTDPKSWVTFADQNHRRILIQNEHQWTCQLGHPRHRRGIPSQLDSWALPYLGRPGGLWYFSVSSNLFSARLCQAQTDKGLLEIHQHVLKTITPGSNLICGCYKSLCSKWKSSIGHFQCHIRLQKGSKHPHRHLLPFLWAHTPPVFRHIISICDDLSLFKPVVRKWNKKKSFVGVGHNEPEIDELIGLKHNFWWPPTVSSSKNSLQHLLETTKDCTPLSSKKWNNLLLRQDWYLWYAFRADSIPGAGKSFLFFLRTKIYK